MSEPLTLHILAIGDHVVITMPRVCSSLTMTPEEARKVVALLLECAESLEARR